MNMKYGIVALTFALSVPAAGQRIWTIIETGHTSSIRSVAFSPDGTQLATSSSDNTIRLWNVSSGRELRRFEGRGLKSTSVAFSPDGTQLASWSSRRLDSSVGCYYWAGIAALWKPQTFG